MLSISDIYSGPAPPRSVYMTLFPLSYCNKKCIPVFSQVRLQTQPKPKPGESLLYAGTIDCFKKTLAKEVRTHTNGNFLGTPSIEIASKKLNLFYSVPSSLLSPTGCERALQRHGGPHRRSHTHVCCLLLWVRTGQEAATEKPGWYSHVGLSAIANASV